MLLDAGEGKLRVLYAIRQIVSQTQRDLTLPDRALLASVSSLISSYYASKVLHRHLLPTITLQRVMTQRVLLYSLNDHKMNFEMERTVNTAQKAS